MIFDALGKLALGEAPATENLYVLVASLGSFALTGQGVGLNAGYKIDVGQGAFVLTGQSVNLLRGYKIAADYGAFVLGGQDIGLKAGFLLTAGLGSFVLTGQSVVLYAGHGIFATTGYYALTFQDVVSKISGAYVFAVQPIGLSVIFDSPPRGAAFVLTEPGYLLAMDGSFLLCMDGSKILCSGEGDTMTYPILFTVHKPDLSMVF